MSHISKMELKINDLPSLIAATKEVGMQFNEGQTQHRYWANKMSPCEHAISAPGSKHEIGVIKEKDGTYGLNWDASFNDLVKFVGSGASKLKQEYAFAVAAKAAKRDGYRAVNKRYEDKKLKFAFVK